ncbi:MAG: aminotransferase class V-fold PLP-dependent enzyme [Bacteroidales bacterium]|nr:aminotransferase class V-fold PLP-dependent enzyme [Candidatus Cacconaster merdequi]
MINLSSDYNNGMHPEVLDAFVHTNDEISLTYGADRWSVSARQRIREACQDPEAEIYFLVGGTQTNATVIHSLMNSFQGVIAVESGHINTHEAGAIERTGHKVIALPSSEGGKLSVSVLENYLDAFFADSNYEHCVIPGMVYITFPTELGALYTRKEISEIYEVCKARELVLYVDGARLGYGMTADGSDIDLPWLSRHCDVFYIGGTKVGAICGEAIVFTHGNAPKYFFSYTKQQGALLAKGRLPGIQFETLFTDGLYFKIARHANEMAYKMRDIFISKGYRIAYESPTNQQFFLIPDSRMNWFKSNLIFDEWGHDCHGNTICRFVTSWATTEADLQALSEVI